ncbi:hypothetical protein BU23DRAFT_575466 [Bimuria novae-zelandiae CBS 107.79]|uniref:Uncharacterized protein n=1 Tax=Bimuria novae-zelandiae CBS 107.79 TaxID=1447943 RepID=A0A6A5UIN3_9PLEO|nr:hypothetical protein BU23DRAFT_575466 [Bimuria novae-zelandiae CBS 107.79]
MPKFATQFPKAVNFAIGSSPTETLSIQPAGYWGSLPANLSAYGPDTPPINDIDSYLPKNLSATRHSFFDWYPEFAELATDIKSPFLGATTAASLTSAEEVFVCNFAWAALLFSSSAILLVTGVAALVLKRLTLGPELFGFVTSLTYENPFVKIPREVARSTLWKELGLCEMSRCMWPMYLPPVCLCESWSGAELTHDRSSVGQNFEIARSTETCPNAPRTQGIVSGSCIRYCMPPIPQNSRE